MCDVLTSVSAEMVPRIISSFHVVTLYLRPFPLPIPPATRRDLALRVSDLTRMLSPMLHVVRPFQSTRNARSMKVLVVFLIVLLQCSVSNPS